MSRTAEGITGVVEKLEATSRGNQKYAEALSGKGCQRLVSEKLTKTKPDPVSSNDV